MRKLFLVLLALLSWGASANEYIGPRKALLAGGVPRPSYTADFTTGVLPAGVTFSRASTAYDFDATGTLVAYSSNVPRFHYDTPSGNMVGFQPNLIHNDTMVGAVAGTPGTPPVNWTITPSGNGLTSSVVGTGVINNVYYMDVRVNGTANAAGNAILITPDTLNKPAAFGQTITAGVYWAFAPSSAGVTTGIQSYQIFPQMVNTAGGGCGNWTWYPAPSSSATSIDKALVQASSFIGCGNTASLNYIFYINSNASGAVDITLRIGMPQLVQGSTAYNPPPATTGSTPAVYPTLSGLLVEQASTNNIRNPRYEGAVAGTPGTQPTYMVMLNNIGATVTVVGTGTESGIPYIDYRFFGTSSGTGVVGPGFEQATQVIAATAQTWTLSANVRLIAGSLTNISSISLGMDEDTAAGAFVTTGQAAIATPTSMPLATQQSVFTRILSGGATVARVVPWLRANITGAGALDVTLRISAPQLEQVGQATSLILPAIGTPAATTRAVESPLVGTAGTAWFNAGAGALVSRQRVAGIPNVFNIELSGVGQDGSDLVRSAIFAGSSNPSIQAFNVSGITPSISGTFINVGINIPFNQALSYNTGSRAVRGATNNQSLASFTATGALPALPYLFLGGSGRGFYLNNVLYWVKYYPGNLSDAQLMRVSQ